MIPITSTAQALEIGRSAKLCEIYELAEARRENLIAVHRAKNLLNTVTGSTRKRIAQIGIDYAFRVQMCDEAIRAFFDKDRN